jgi:mannitol/fructose-specific phosphotransferase system IIA component (Ntr-type)
MSREILSLEEAAKHINMAVHDLKHAAQRGEIESFQRGDAWYFEHRTLDEWAQRNLLEVSSRDLKARHRLMAEERHRAGRDNWGIADLFSIETTDLFVQAKAKGGLLRDMTDLAEKGGKVYDSEALFKELVSREEAASTAIGEGVALLHPRFHDPYLFEESFVAYGRCERPVFFGAPDGEGTKHFFLICSTDHRAHLHILARLAVLAHGSNMIAQLDEAEDAQAALEIIRSCEEAFL